VPSAPVRLRDGQLDWLRRLFGLGRTGHAQPEETRTVPGRACNSPRDGRETRIGRALPEETIGHDSDGVALALVFAHDDGAGLEAAVELAWFPAAGEPIEQLDRLPVEAAEGFLLDSVGDHPSHDVLGQARWRGRAERHSPPPAKRVDAEGPDPVDLGLDRSGVCRPLVHGQAAA